MSRYAPFGVRCDKHGLCPDRYSTVGDAAAYAVYADARYAGFCSHVVVLVSDAPTTHVPLATVAGENRKESTMSATPGSTVTVLIPADLADTYANRAGNPARVDRFGSTLADRINDTTAVYAIDLTATEAAFFLADCDKPWPKGEGGKSVRDYVADAVLGR